LCVVYLFMWGISSSTITSSNLAWTLKYVRFSSLSACVHAIHPNFKKNTAI
jgi:hypothetical protein